MNTRHRAKAKPAELAHKPGPALCIDFIGASSEKASPKYLQRSRRLISIASSTPVLSSTLATPTDPSAQATPDAPVSSTPELSQGASSAGMNRRVASGGAWTMLGELARFVAALIATHFTTRMLGPEGYGVWSQITRIGGSLSFADAGVGVASTKFVSQAHARGDAEGERRALWASLLVGLVPSILIALAMLGIAPWLVHKFFFNIPPHLKGPMVAGLQISSFAFAMRTVTAVFNSPLLARLQLKLNTLIFYGGIVAQILLVPLALRLGGFAWGASVALIVWAATGGAYLLITARLLPGSLRPVLDREMLKPIARMGAGTLVMALAAQALYSADVFIVGRLRSSEDAGYYNIAFQASTMLSILPAASSQALMPAFSRLMGRGEQAELQALVRKAMRASCLVLPPIVALMCVVARPFFEHWLTNPAYARNATPVFMCLIAGLALNVLMTVPTTLLLAMGRTGTTARFGLFEIVPFVGYTWALTKAYGIMGAAMGRGLRFVIACAILFPLTSRISKIGFSPRLRALPFVLGLVCAGVPIALALWPGAPLWAQLGAAIVGVGLYAAVVYAQVLEPGERALVQPMLKRVQERFKK